MKIKLLPLLVTLLLTSCGNKSTNDLKIICPTGAPAVAFYFEAKNDNFQTNSVPTNIIPMMSGQSEKDIVVIDTVSGIQDIKNGSPYLLAATLTFGNFYLASTGHDDNNQLDSEDCIVLFGQDTTPDLIFHNVYGNDYDKAIEYVSGVQDAAKCLIASKNLATGNDVDYVFIAQPVLYNALKKNANASIYANIQELYKEKNNNKSLIQASLFVNKNTPAKKIDDYLATLKTKIEEGIANPSLIKEGINQLSNEEASALYGITGEVAEAVISDHNSLGLGYKSSYEMKNEIDAFLKLFDMEETNEEIYYK